MVTDSNAATAGQIAALKWLKEQPALLLPSTTYPPYCWPWKDHSPATPQSFWSLEHRGLAYRQKEMFWYLTEDGESALAEILAK